MAYDTARAVTVLYRGFDRGRPLRDTWTWDGTTWVEVHPAQSRAPNLSLGYDAAHRMIVGFGPAAMGGASGETWLVFGDVGKSLAHRAHCPVLLMPSATPNAPAVRPAATSAPE